MTPSRLIGGLFLLIALVAFVADIIMTASAGGLTVIPLGQRWFDFHPASLNFLQAIVQRYVHPVLWDLVIVFLLKWPAWLFFGLIGFFIYRRRPGSLRRVARATRHSP